MEILILGVVLLVLGVGATFIYDKHKDDQVKAREAAQVRVAQRESARLAAAQLAAKAAALKPGPFTKAASTTTAKKTVRKTVKPGSIKAGSRKPNDPPQEVEYLEVFFDDVSINSKVTIQELIEKIERMKKKR